MVVVTEIFHKVISSSLFDFFLGFLLVFIAVYGLLYKTNLFKNKRVHTLIAFGFALLFVYYVEIARVTERFIAITSYAVLATVSAIMFLALLFGKQSPFKKLTAFAIALGLVGLSYYRAITPITEYAAQLGIPLTEEDIGVIIMIGIIILAVAYLVSPGEEKPQEDVKTKIKNFLEGVVDKLFEERQQ